MFSPVERIIAGAVLVVALLIGGQLWLMAHDATVRAEARTGYVTQAVLDASEAKRLKAESDAKFATQAADSARKQADNAHVALQIKEDELNARIKADTDPDISRWRQLDLDRLR
jgi:hypothetical protein